MAYRELSAGTTTHEPPANTTHTQTLEIHGGTVQLPDASYVKDADISRHGADLILKGPDGTIVVHDYFAADPAPALAAPGGATLTPELVNSFLGNGHEFAAANTANDVSPVGAVHEVSGHATVTHADGTTETITLGTKIFEGDVITTDAKGAVNIMFIDQTTFAVSEDARLAIDKYVFDPSTQAGETDFSILKGVFVFTSGLIGRDDPDTVHIDTPAGSIGIRGTIIAGNVHTGEITVVEGAIVLHDLAGHSITLATQYETAKFNPGGEIQHIGQLSANDLSARFESVSHVTPVLFSNINDSAHDAPEHSPGDAHSQQPGDNTPADHPATPNDVHGDAAQPAGTAPLGIANISGFGDSSGFAAQTLSNTAPPPAVSGGTNALGTSGALGGFGTGSAPPPAGVLPPPPPPVHADTTADTTAATVAGTTINNPPPNTGTTDTAPTHAFAAPAEFFKSTSGQEWHFSFASEFRDMDIRNGDVLHFDLDINTQNMLNSMTYDATGPSPDVLAPGVGTGMDNIAGDEGHGWSFNTATGQLDLFFGSAFDGTQVPLGLSQDFDINIRAVDSAGAATPFETYLFSAYNPTNTLATGTFPDFIYDSKVATPVLNTGPSNGTIVSDNAIIIFEQKNYDDSITIDNTGSVNTGSGNIVIMGNGNNLATVENDAFNNRIIGGEGTDTFLLKTAQVQVHGMGGDDVFALDLTNGPNIQNELATTTSNTIIDGGGSDFRAGARLASLGLNAMGSNGGRGDTLQLVGTGTLDFSAINSNNKITNIDRLDLASDGGAQTATLNYNDVLKMTNADHGHALIINVGSGDTLNLNGAEFANMRNQGPKQDNYSLDDGAQGTPDVKPYDVYSNGQVTVLIHADAGATVHMDGTTVAV